MDYWLQGSNSGNDEDTTQGTGQDTGLGGNGLMDWGGPADTLPPKPAREKTLGEWLYPDMKPTQGYGGPGDAGDGEGSGLGSGNKRRRVSAAGFDIDTGEYVGPDRYTPIGFNPDTGEPIMPGQDPAPGNEPEPLYIPQVLKDKHPAARVLWAVQTGQLPYLKGLPAIDENGGLHPAYARAVGGGEETSVSEYSTPSPLKNAQDFFGGCGDFVRNYNDMREANTIGADKYFHCKANCEATQRGPGGRAASILLGEGREYVDEYIKGDSREECDADRAANRLGREGDPDLTCEDICSPVRPPALDEKY